MGRIKVVLPAAEASKLVAEVGASARSFYEENGLPLPHLVLLPRTGYEIGPTIARDWDIDALYIFSASIRKKETGMNAGGRAVFEYGQLPTPEDVAGLNLLLLDGVCKSGETLEHMAKLLEFAGAAAVKTAVMMHKPNETTTGFVPDFVGTEVVDGAFYVFPWEMAEHLPAPEGEAAGQTF